MSAGAEKLAAAIEAIIAESKEKLPIIQEQLNDAQRKKSAVEALLSRLDNLVTSCKEGDMLAEVNSVKKTLCSFQQQLKDYMTCLKELKREFSHGEWNLFNKHINLGLLSGPRIGTRYTASIAFVRLLEERKVHMSLMICPECGHDVSTFAEMCPNCGYPMSGSALNSKGIAVKGSVNDYTWAELSQISAIVSAAGTEEAAIDVAKHFGLCSPSGTLDGTQAKTIVLVDDVVADVQIIGFNHDDKSDGSGKAGITFLFKDCVAEYKMNIELTNLGGWSASDIRRWLNTTLLSTLPQDLASVIAVVDKFTNNVGETESIGSVSSTQDGLWLPSTCELAGQLGRWRGYSLQVHNDIANAEGSQYKLFRDRHTCQNPSNNEQNNILVKVFLPASSFVFWLKQGAPCRWWSRSPTPSSSETFENVTIKGSPTSILGEAYLLYGVAPAFCI